MSAIASATPAQSEVRFAPARIPRAVVALILIVIVIAGTLARFINLAGQHYETDEYWHAELSTGRGSVEKHLPHNQLLTFDNKVTSLAGADPWWKIWTRMDDTVHPPLYPIALRFWRATFGERRFASRSLGATASVLSILLMFELARRLHGATTALWSAAIMALASPQIALARSLRGYTFELMWILLAALMVIVIAQSQRRSWWTLITLFLATLAAMLSHYFAAFAFAAIGIYALVCLRGRARAEVVAALSLALIAFIAVWSPQLRLQIANLPAATETWISDAYPGHVQRALVAFASVPSRMLFEPRHEMAAFAIPGASLFVLPILFLRRRTGLLLWVLWLWFVSAPLLMIDLSRETKHLSFIRYILIAGPAVYALLAGLLQHMPRASLRDALPAVVVLACLLSIGSAYEDPRGDFRSMAEFLDEHRVGTEPVIFSSQTKGWIPIATFLALCDESRSFPWPVIVADEPLNPTLLASIRQSGGAILICDSDAHLTESIPPGAKYDAGTIIPWVGMISHVKFEPAHDKASSQPTSLTKP